MAAYPITTFSRDSFAQAADGRVLVRATNGSLKARLLYTGDKRTFTLQHRLKASEWSTLNTFYGSNRGTSFTLAFDGGTSTCVFARPPELRPQPGGLYLVTVTAEEV